MKIKQKIKAAVSRFCEDKIKNLHDKKRSLLIESVSTLEDSTVKIESEGMVWSCTAPGGLPSNTVFDPHTLGGGGLRMQIQQNENGDIIGLKPLYRYNKEEARAAIGGVSSRNYKALKALDTKALFWHNIKDKYGI